MRDYGQNDDNNVVNMGAKQTYNAIAPYATITNAPITVANFNILTPMCSYVFLLRIPIGTPSYHIPHRLSTPHGMNWVINLLTFYFMIIMVIMAIMAIMVIYGSIMIVVKFTLHRIIDREHIPRNVFEKTPSETCHMQC